MAEAPELQLHIMGQEAKEATPLEHCKKLQIPGYKKCMRWFRVFIYSIFVLSGQTAATLLGRLYYDKGGNSTWIATFVQTSGFPILFPLYFLSETKKIDPTMKSPPVSVLASVYVLFGVFLGVVSLLYSVGLLYVPVSTYSLICASQLGFNALFSFFLNSQKFTPFIINSLVLLTISSTLLVSQGEDDHDKDSKHVPRGKYIIGFVCTIGASAGYGLMLSVTQFCFQRVLKQETFKVVLDMIIYPSSIATLAVLVGLFASGDWKDLRGEMEVYSLGKVSYLMTLIWTGISWQLFNIGCVGLVFEVSSLFSNVISTLGLPIVPVLAVFTFGDKMDGIKAVAMVLAIWAFISYVYQHYLDDQKAKTELGNVRSEEVSSSS